VLFTAAPSVELTGGQRGPELEMAMMSPIGMERERSSGQEELRHLAMVAMAMVPAAAERMRARAYARGKMSGECSLALPNSRGSSKGTCRGMRHGAGHG
jgi:hypothetical protein